MEITQTLYVSTAEEWRQWLAENHRTAKDIWLMYPVKASGKQRIPYGDAVDEALCFGWIDSTAKRLDAETSLQRFSPRRKNSVLSEMNKERMRRLIAAGKMTNAGLESVKHHILNYSEGMTEISFGEFIFPEDILAEIQKDPEVWKNYNSFPEYYQRIRIAYIEEYRTSPEIFQRRLNYFIKKTKQNKRFGLIQ